MNNIIRKALTALTATALAVVMAVGSSSMASAADVTAQRLYGADRYATGTAISKATYSPGVPVVYIANGLAYADALAGAAVAGRDGVPMLLVKTNEIPSTVATELRRLKPSRIVILGGTGVVSGKVAGQLKSYAGSVTRQSGSDRYSTAAAISRASYLAGVDVAYIAGGLAEADALAGAPAAALKNSPMLLTTATTLSPATAAELQRLKPKRIVILGGRGAVSGTVAGQLKAYTSGSVTRLAGYDRYDTAAAISKATFGAGVPAVYVANGLAYADALAGAAAAGKTGSPVLLARQGELAPSVKNEVSRLKPGSQYLLGGPTILGSILKTIPAPVLTSAQLQKAVDGYMQAYCPNATITVVNGWVDGKYGSVVTGSSVKVGSNYGKYPAENIKLMSLDACGHIRGWELYGNTTDWDASVNSVWAGVQGTTPRQAQAACLAAQWGGYTGGLKVPSYCSVPGAKELVTAYAAGKKFTAAAAPAPTTAPVEQPATTAPATTDFDAYDREMFDLINAERTKAGVPALKWSTSLHDAATRHSEWMADNTYSHVDQDQGLADAAAAGCESGYAENIYWLVQEGNTDPAVAMAGYMASPGHKANILNPDVTHVGPGTTQDGSDVWNTQRFGFSCTR